MLCTRDLCGALSGAGLMRVAASAWTAPSSLFRRFYVRHRTAHSVRRADKSSRPVSRVRPNSKEEKTNEQVRERFQTTDMAYGGGPRRLDRRMRRRDPQRVSRGVSHLRLAAGPIGRRLSISAGPAPAPDSFDLPADPDLRLPPLTRS